MSKLSEPEVPNAAVEIVFDATNLEITSSHSPMTLAEARQCIEAIKGHLVNLRRLILALEERQGWKALGYSSMTACLVGEFPSDSKTKLIRALSAGRIERYQQVPIGTYLESQLRPLFKLAPEQWKPALEKAHAYASNSSRLTATHVSRAVTDLRSQQLSQIKPATSPPLSYKQGDIILINCDRAVKEAYAKYNCCWGVVENVLTHGCIVQLMGQRWQIHSNDIKEMDLVDETLKLVATRVVTLLEREDLDEMEREILERYHKRLWFTPWQLQLLQTIEEVRTSLNDEESCVKDED